MEEMIHRSFCTKNCSMQCVKLLCADLVPWEGNVTGSMCRSRPSS